MLNTSIYKSNIVVPSYNDGYFNLYKICQKGKFPLEYLKLIVNKIPFKEQSIGDKLKYELKARDIDIEFKIIIREEKSINSIHVIEIGNELYHVLSTYHFIDSDGFRKTRLSLEKYTLKGV